MTARLISASLLGNSGHEIITTHTNHPAAMARSRKYSNASSESSLPERNQELESMYDYLAKVILVGPSGTGKSCLLHRFVKDEWRVLSSQTIGVEFSSKIVKVGTGPRRKRIKLQLWDTAGTERFRSVSRSYYRGAAGAILVYDISSYPSFTALPTFLMDARALASPNLTVLLAGNKSDLLDDFAADDNDDTDSDDTEKAPSTSPSMTSASVSSKHSFAFESSAGSVRSIAGPSAGTRMTATTSAHGREVSDLEALEWARKSNIPVAVDVSALSGRNVDELFNRLARIILTKIELGEIDPDDPQSGIQYGDAGVWPSSFGGDGGSIRSGLTVDDNNSQLHKGRNARRQGAAGTGSWASGAREWESVFRIRGRGNRGCC
ncbi:GTP-binding protein ypt4 [Talaromyces islandicus]|uniref:GTP-binding protein ypt4 n=1 Tax=Talaromyces islandicus TaxID=28573 RepID=A0A0U1M7F5_TALIS|nr:GTP-binding protein ypt4 [Talaromyces islandicus]